MKGHEWDLYSKSGSESQQQPQLYAAAQLAIQQHCQVKCIAPAHCLLVIVAQRNYSCQHQQAAYRGIEHKLDCCIDAAFTAPASYQQISRDQHQFPENVEQEEIGSQEDAYDTALQQQHESHVILSLLLDTERRSNAHHCQQARKHHEQKADAINTHAVIDTQDRNPGNILVKEKCTAWGIAWCGSTGCGIGL